LAATDVARVGEGIALRDLLLKGFTIQKWNTPQESPGKSDIEVVEPVTEKHILIQVKSAIEPNMPEDLSSDLENALKLHASQCGAEAWEAKVQLNERLSEGKVSWRQLT